MEIAMSREDAELEERRHRIAAGMTQASAETTPIDEDAFGLVELPEGCSLLEQDAILKMNAGAMLTFAVWSLPKDVVSELFKNAPQAFHTSYMAACQAYGVNDAQSR